MIKLDKNTHRKGFTLIELMVVISIIGVLSSITLSSVALARLKARDGKIIQQVNQMRTQIELEYSDSASFEALQTGWLGTAAQCDGTFSGLYAVKAREICKAIIGSSAANFACSGCLFYTGVDASLGYSNIRNYSIMAYLPGTNVFYCVGNSGRSSRVNNTQYSTTGWNSPGCYSNP